MSKRIILERKGSQIEVWEHQSEYLISKGWQHAADTTDTTDTTDTQRWQSAADTDDINQEENEDGES